MTLFAWVTFFLSKYLVSDKYRMDFCKTPENILMELISKSVKIAGNTVLSFGEVNL